MAHFLFFCVASVGLTTILVEGKIFQSFRDFFARGTDRIRQRREKKNLPPRFSLMEKIHEILSCHQCCGFWSGLFCGLFWLTSKPFWGEFPLDVRNPQLMFVPIAFLCCGFVGSILSTLTDLIARFVFFQTELAKQQLSRFEQPQPHAEEFHNHAETPEHAEE